MSIVAVKIMDIMTSMVKTGERSKGADEIDDSMASDAFSSPIHYH